MSFYGIRKFDFAERKFAYAVFKTLSAPDHTYGIMQSPLAKYICVLNDNATLTFVNSDTQSNTTIDKQSGLLDLSPYIGTNTNVVTGNTSVDTLMLLALKPKEPFPELANVEIVTVTDSYSLEEGKAALVINGTVTVPVGNTTFDANSDVDIYSIGPRDTSTTLTGTGRLIVFKIV